MKALNYLEANASRHMEEMKECLRMETISADPKKEGEIKRCGEWLVKKLTVAGFENARLVPTGGLPAVYADWLHAGPDKPTFMVYGHYDVQPVDPIDLWETPPFEPTIKDGKIYGRGTADDKCQLLIHLFALEAILKTEGKLPVNVKFFLESEEEGGTGSTTRFVKENSKLLACDAVVLSDTAWVAEDVPAITYGLRGIAFFEAKVKGPNRDLHSGRFGGLVQNPLNAIASIISKFHDKDGRIPIPHFYDDVVKVSDEERQEFKKLGDNEGELKTYLDVKDLWGEKGYTTYERNWARPCLDVNGIWGGYAGEGSKTVIPSEGGFKFSVRLVPDQTPKKVEEMVIKYVKEVCPPGVEVDVQALHGGPPALVPLDNQLLQTARKAMEKGFGQPVVFVRDAASVPIVGTFKEALGAFSILMGFDIPSGNIHAPNENFKLDHFHKGMASAVHFYTDAAKVK